MQGGQPVPTGKQTLGLRPTRIDRSPQSVQPGSSTGVPVPHGAEAFMEAYQGAIEIRDGGRRDPVFNPTLDHLRADVRTLDGKPV